MGVREINLCNSRIENEKTVVIYYITNAGVYYFV